MEIDDELMSDFIKNAYEAKDIYIIQYKGGEELSTSNGIINEIQKGKNSYNLFHTLILMIDLLEVILFYLIIKL